MKKFTCYALAVFLDAAAIGLLIAAAGQLFSGDQLQAMVAAIAVAILIVALLNVVNSKLRHLWRSWVEPDLYLLSSPPWQCA